MIGFKPVRGFPPILLPGGASPSIKTGFSGTTRSSMAVQPPDVGQGHLAPIRCRNGRNLGIRTGARGLGGRLAPTKSPRQLKEVIQMVHTNVGPTATLGVLIGCEVNRLV